MSKLLRIEDLHTYFKTSKGLVKAVNGVTFEIEKGQTVGIVGESGSGKSITAMSIMQIVDKPGYIHSGKIYLEDTELTGMTESELRTVRGNDISYIFQEPMTSLNPVIKVGKQISETILLHQDVTKKEAKQIAIDMLDKVKVSRPNEVYNNYPFELSGGIRQRVMIAIALSCNPKLLIADEPTTALDVTIQAQILALMDELKNDVGASILFITHDLGVIGEMADYVVVMYCGQVVEAAHVDTIFGRPEFIHPYTEGLMNSIPSIDDEKDRLEVIPGSVPHPLNLPKGCKFAPRCKYATSKCLESEPEYVEVEKNHSIRCFYPKRGERNE